MRHSEDINLQREFRCHSYCFYSDFGDYESLAYGRLKVNKKTGIILEITDSIARLRLNFIDNTPISPR